MADLLSIEKAYRARLLAADQDVASDLVGAYRAVYDRLKAELAKALADLQSDPESIAYRVARLRELEGQVIEHMARFAAMASGRVTQAQAGAVQMAVDSTVDQLSLALTPAPPTARIDSRFARVPVRAVESLAGFASDGSPLAELFATLGPAAGEAVRDRILSGLALGFGPDKIAAEMRDELGVPLSRALRIARTETMRAYRTAATEYLQENDEFVKGWYWKASGGLRTCAACWAMDGTFHPIEEPFYSHVCCRCTTIPAAKSWAEMGYDGMPDRTWKPAETGEEAFAKLSEQEQRQILGPGKYELYRNGDISLSDVVKEGRDARWGPYRIERPLRDMQAATGGGAAQPPAPPSPVLQPRPDPVPEKVDARLTFDEAKTKLFEYLDQNPGAMVFNRGAGGLPALRQALADQGFDARPHVVTRAQFDAYRQQGEELLYRGVAARDHATQFQSDPSVFAGHGIFGHGTYMSAGPGARDLAEYFARSKAHSDGVPGDGWLMQMVLRPEARVIDVDDLEAERQGEIDLLAQDILAAVGRGDWIEVARLTEHRRGIENRGVFATLKGYDAIMVPSRRAAPTYPVSTYGGRGQQHHEYVILNRSAVRVLDEIEELNP